MIGAVALMQVLVAGVPAADAHTSNYCGHGTDGWLVFTTFTRTLQPTPHEHEYRHWVIDYSTGLPFTLHYRSRVC